MPPPGQFSYARGFTQPLYSGFYSEPSYGTIFSLIILGSNCVVNHSKGESAGPTSGEGPDTGSLMSGYGAVSGASAEKKEEPYSAQAFSQGLGLGFFPKGEDSESGESRGSIVFNFFSPLWLDK